MYGILLATAIWALILFLVKRRTSEDSVNFSGIPKPSIAQLLKQIIKNEWQFDVLKILHSLKTTYGDTFLIHIIPFSPVVVTSDPKYFGQILAAKEHLGKTFVTSVFENIGGNSIFSTFDVEIWRHDRKILNDAFGHQSHKEFLRRLEEMLHRLDEVIMERIDGPVDMQDAFHEFLLHSVIESLKDPCVSWDSQRTTEYKKWIAVYMGQTLKRLLPMMLNMDVLFKLTSSYADIQRSVKVIRQFAVDFVDTHLEAKDRQTDANNIIYRLHDAGVPHERIVDNVVLFIEGGYATVATTLSYTIFELAKRPDIQNKILAEVQGQVGKDQNVSISAVDVYHLKYTQNVVREGLRRHSAVSIVSRKLNKSTVIDNAVLSKGTNVLFFIDGLHKSEKCYKEPLTFDPDRFSAENRKDLVAHSWAPFGLGIRNCIGQSLAMQKMTLIVAKMVRRYEFSPVVPEHKLDIKSSLMSVCTNGVPVLVKVRSC